MEPAFDGGLLGFGEFDLDLDRELLRDPAGELFCDSAGEELRDLEPDFPDLTDRGECDASLATSFTLSGDFEGDLDVLRLPPDFELDLDVLWFLTDPGEAEPFREGEPEGDLEYDFLELALECTEAGDPGCPGDDRLDLGEDFRLPDLLLALCSTLADLCESGDGLLDLSCSSSESLLSSSRPIAPI